MLWLVLLEGSIALALPRTDSSVLDVAVRRNTMLQQDDVRTPEETMDCNDLRSMTLERLKPFKAAFEAIEFETKGQRHLLLAKERARFKDDKAILRTGKRNLTKALLDKDINAMALRDNEAILDAIVKMTNELEEGMSKTRTTLQEHKNKCLEELRSAEKDLVEIKKVDGLLNQMHLRLSGQTHPEVETELPGKVATAKVENLKSFLNTNIEVHKEKFKQKQAQLDALKQSCSSEEARLHSELEQLTSLSTKTQASLDKSRQTIMDLQQKTTELEKTLESTQAEFYAMMAKLSDPLFENSALGNIQENVIIAVQEGVSTLKNFETAYHEACIQGHVQDARTP